jgi:hypothetical protein
MFFSEGVAVPTPPSKRKSWKYDNKQHLKNCTPHKIEELNADVHNYKRTHKIIYFAKVSHVRRAEFENEMITFLHNSHLFTLFTLNNKEKLFYSA